MLRPRTLVTNIPRGRRVQDGARRTLSVLRGYLERAVRRFAGEVETHERPTEDRERIVAYLDELTRHAASESPSELDETVAPPVGSHDDVTLALQGIRQLQRSLLSGSLVHREGGRPAAHQVERMFDVLSRAGEELAESWISGESRRQTELLAQSFHDLRSPLTSILFLAEALYTGNSGPLSETQKQQMRLIYAASVTLLTLVENVLSSRKLEVGELEWQSVPLSVVSVGDEVARITRPMAEQRRLQLVFEYHCRPGRLGDPDALRRILLNLVTNAINYTETGGVTVRFEESDGDLVLKVEDTGPGIPEEQLAELFTPFRSGATERDRGVGRFSGAGLGLSICHRLARMAGGDIWVETELGKGSCFGVRLPFSRTA